MREEVLNPTCSELVVPLDLGDDIEAIREALKVAEEITGWKLSVEIFTLDDEKWVYYRDIKPEDVIIEYNRYGGKTITIREDILKDIFFPKVNSWTRVGLRHPETPTGRWLSAEEMEKYIYLLQVSYEDGYCDHTTVFMAFSHGYKPHYEPMEKIAIFFGKREDLHSEDGGSMEYFEKWEREWLEREENAEWKALKRLKS
ncbi:MAG: hypothetical protein ACXQTS_06685 [Candidatus Methanospirareceae archaeon]